MSNHQLELSDYANSVFRALSLFMGRGRQFSVDDVATGTGIKGRRLSSYIAADPDERSCPPSDVLIALCCFFGKPFTSKVLSVVGQGAFDLEPQLGDPARVISTLSQGTAEFTRLGLDDGRYCHLDEGKLEPTADLMIATLTPFSSRGKR